MPIKFKLDECLPVEIKEILENAGYAADTVIDEGLNGSPDEVIWTIVQQEGLFLFTADLDFSDTRRFVPGTHPGILLLRLNKEGKGHMLAYMKKLISENNLYDWAGCFVVATFLFCYINTGLINSGRGCFFTDTFDVA